MEPDKEIQENTTETVDEREARRLQRLNRHSAWNRFRREWRRDRRYFFAVLIVSAFLALVVIGFQRVTLDPADRVGPGVTMNLQERILQRMREGKLTEDDKRILDSLTVDDIKSLRDMTGR